MQTKLEMFKFYNANPKGRRVDDCVIRAISFAEGDSWEETYDKLSEYAKEEGIILNEVTFVDGYLDSKYPKHCYKCEGSRATIKDFIRTHKDGTYLITMKGHITCLKDGAIYDTWDCTNNRIWTVWRVR